MNTTELLLAFTVYAIVSMLTPGPNNMMLMTSGLHYGIRMTVPHMLGVAFGFGFMVFAAGMGLLSVLDQIPLLYHILHIGSILYLLYLAWAIASAAPLKQDSQSKKKPMTFFQAVAFQWINPKAIIMAIAAVTTYVPEGPASDLFFNVGMVALIYTAVGLPSTFLWTAFGNALRRFLSDPLHYRIFNISMAIFLVMSLYPMIAEML